ncbi:MAG: putative manganese transporter [Oscillospiraceae bacterium]
MAQQLLDVFLDALLDTAKTAPFLYAAFLLIEFLEHHQAGRLAGGLKKLGPFGPAGGALLGAVPQCGFSVAATNLYAGRLVTLGTLLAVYISTSDEAVIILLSDPENLKTNLGIMWKIVVVKILIALTVGILIDAVLRVARKKRRADNTDHFKEICTHCGCEGHSVFLSALRHTGEIALFLFAVNFLLNSAITFAGENNISKILMTDSVFQPLLAAVVGFIPNCAASAIITQLYIDGALSFGSVIAGLVTSAGVGLAMLFKANKHLKENFAILGILYATAAVSGIALELFF